MSNLESYLTLPLNHEWEINILWAIKIKICRTKLRLMSRKIINKI